MEIILKCVRTRRPFDLCESLRYGLRIASLATLNNRIRDTSLAGAASIRLPPVFRHDAGPQNAARTQLALLVCRPGLRARRIGVLTVSRRDAVLGCERAP